MHPDLVSPAGLQLAFEQRGVAKHREATPVSDGALAATAFDDGDLLAVGRRPRERRIDLAFCFGHASNDREVAALDAVRSELLRQTFVSDVGLRDYQQSRRILVDTVD